MQLLKPPWINHDNDKAIFGVDIHPDGSRFATGGQGQDSSGRVVIWNLLPVIFKAVEVDEKVPKLLCQLDQHLGCVNSVRWSNCGNYLASAGDDKVIIIWQQSSYAGGTVFGSNIENVESWRIVSTLRGHNGDILDVAWSPQDIWLASASIDNNVIVWNAKKWPEQIKVLRGHTGMVKGVTWDPTGRYLASQADDKSVRIWRSSNWKLEKIITEPFSECGGTTTVLRPNWSPDGQYLVSAHSMNNGGPTAQIIERDGWKTDKDFVGHRKAISCVRFNPNILNKTDTKSGKVSQYSCIAIGSRDHSISIWFTSLKRPLVVIHDIFTDSVLDLSWSRCGRYLLTVSKDGTMAVVSFSEDEIGKALTQEQLIKVHTKLYGKSDLNFSEASSLVIENPELLKVQKIKEQNLREQRLEEKRLQIPVGPLNKQIEIRTADGRRRITPMFIPPPAKGETDRKSQDEENFSSSRTEKSSIIIEKMDGVIEPNVTTPTKSPEKSLAQSSGNNLAQTPSKVQENEISGVTKLDAVQGLEMVPAGLSARMENISTNEVAKPTKRRIEQSLTPAKKKKSARRNLYEKPDNNANISQDNDVGSPPHSPLMPAESDPAVHISMRESGNVVGNGTEVVRKSVLNAMSLPKVSKMQIPHRNQDGSISYSQLMVENHWKSFDTGSAGVRAPSVHRVSRIDSDCDLWVKFFTSQVISCVVSNLGVAAIACRNSTLNLIDLENGNHLFPALHLNGICCRLYVQSSFVFCLTTNGTLNIWDFVAKRKVFSQSLLHLVETGNGVKSIELIKITNQNNVEKSSKIMEDNLTKNISVVSYRNEQNSTSAEYGDKTVDGQKSSQDFSLVTPIVIVSTGESYSWYSDLESWVQIGESSSVRQLVNPKLTFNNSIIKSVQTPLSKILLNNATYAGNVGLKSSFVSCDVTQGISQSFVENMLTTAKHFYSEIDFKMWHRRLVRFYISEGMENELRKVFDDLNTFESNLPNISKNQKKFESNSPITSKNKSTFESNSLNSKTKLEISNTSNNTDKKSKKFNDKYFGVNKRELLNEYLKELLMSENSIRFQRLHSEYSEQSKKDPDLI